MADEIESLSSILSKTEAPAPVVPVVEPPKAEPAAETVDKARDEQGRFASKEEKPAAEKQAEKPPLKSADIAAIIDERRKRQALEEQLKALKSDKPAPDFWENPADAVSQRVQEATSPLKAQLFKMSMKAAKQGREDFDQVAEAFMSASEADPSLIKQLREHDDPGEFVYQFGKHHMELSSVGGDLGKYREKLTAESAAQLAEKDKTIAALQAELNTLKDSQTKLASVPRSLNSTPSGSTPVSGEDDDSIKSIVRFGNSKR